MTKTHVVIKSSNSKIGPMAATYRTMDSCPSACPFLKNGCYADGRIFSIAEKYGREDLSALYALAEPGVVLPFGIRFGVSGDFVLLDGSPDYQYIEACNAVADAHPGVVKICYTHHWKHLSPDLFRFTVNASCETVEDVQRAVAAGWQAVIVNGEDGSMIGDKRVVTCLAETKKIPCAVCKLCGQDSRTRPVVSFTAHGPTKKKAIAAVSAANA